MGLKQELWADCCRTVRKKEHKLIANIAGLNR